MSYVQCSHTLMTPSHSIGKSQKNENMRFAPFHYDNHIISYTMCSNIVFTTINIFTLILSQKTGHVLLDKTNKTAYGSNRIFVSSRLNIRHFTAEDEGEYVCKISTKSSNHNTSARYVLRSKGKSLTLVKCKKYIVNVWLIVFVFVF